MSATNGPYQELMSLRSGRFGFVSGFRVSDTALKTLVMAACVASLWLTTRPYLGIIHDSLLYTVQALHAIYPGKLDSDLYFKYGSQDEFTLFTYLYVPVIKAIGLVPANLSLTVIGQMAWLAGLLYFLLGLRLRLTEALMSVAFAIALPSTYGFGHIFAYGEPFLTPRLLAEAMVLTAMGLLVRGRTIPALLVAALAASIHPLMALPGLAVIFLREAGRRPLWWALALAGALLFLGLAVAGIAPFSRLTMTYDPEWFEVVKERLAFALILQWTLFDYSLLLATAAMMVLVWMYADRWERRFLRATVVVTAGGLLCTLVGADLLRNVFIVNIQPWRVLWLLAIVANIFVLPVLLRTKADRSPDGRLILAGLILGVFLLALARFQAAIVVLAAFVLVVTSVLAGWLRLGGSLHYRFVHFGALILLGLVIGCTLILAYYSVAINLSLPNVLWTIAGRATQVTAAFGLMLTIGLGERAWRGRLKFLSGVLALGLLCSAVLLWDNRRPWEHFVEADGPGSASLSALLPEHSNVYWEGGVGLMWFRLKRPEYFSCLQGAGTMFFRGTAMDYWRRAESFRRLRTVDFGYGVACPSLGTNLTASPAAADLLYACERERQLDYLVLLHAIPGASTRVWQAPVKADILSRDRYDSSDGPTVTHQDRYFIYDCRVFRGKAQLRAAS
jgi:hypothetical protein